MFKKTCLCMILLFLSGCQLLTPETQALTPDSVVPLPNVTPPIEAQATYDLVNFYVYLNHGRYDDAVDLYGGSYETLQYFNPDVDPDDKSALLKRGCEQNGLPCLQLYDYDLLDRPTEREFFFMVSFRNADNSIFLLGPCCGADETEMPPVSQFEVHVICIDDYSCQVLDLPPYVP